MYALGLGAAAALDGRSMAEATFFDPTEPAHREAGRLAAAAAMAAGAAIFLVGAPWLFGVLTLRRVRLCRATAGAWSLGLNSLALVAVATALRSTCGLDRKSVG